jgi:serine/threonine protein phosphatase 1
VAVIGDVHGQTDSLRRIIASLAKLPDIHRRWIVFIGDLVDRGPDPAGTVQFYLDLTKQHDRVTCVCGNHELAMAGSLKLFNAPSYVDFSKRWLNHYESHSTFGSYGVPHGDLDALAQALPPDHRNLLADLPWSIEHSEYLFVHAGLDANLPFETQIRILRERDFSLSHPPWLYSKEFIRVGPPAECPVTVVLGHTPVPEVQYTRQQIAIDTSGGFGELSCVLLPENLVISSDDEGPPRPLTIATTRKSWWKLR